MKADRLRSKIKLEGRKRPLEPKGWRDKAELNARKSVAQAEGQLTREEPEGRGDICPRWSRGREKPQWRSGGHCGLRWSSWVDHPGRGLQILKPRRITGDQNSSRKAEERQCRQGWRTVQAGVHRQARNRQRRWKREVGRNTDSSNSVLGTGTGFVQETETGKMYILSKSISIDLWG